MLCACMIDLQSRPLPLRLLSVAHMLTLLHYTLLAGNHIGGVACIATWDMVLKR